jgi:pyruvate,orthophosphate dikinase
MNLVKYDEWKDTDAVFYSTVFLDCIAQEFIEKGRKIKSSLELGICGEHGGDPRSINFCHNNGLNYVSASPHRIPIAIVAAAQAMLEKPAKTKRKIAKKPKKKTKKKAKRR